MNNFDTFMIVYKKQLKDAVVNYPQEYQFPIESVPDVVEKMGEGFNRGTYNKDGRAIKATCKELGIKYTYTAINEYLRH